MGRQSRLAWAGLAALGAMAAWFWLIDKRTASMGVAVAMAGCLGLILPPRERMGTLPWRIRALPRRYDAAPILASLVGTPGFGLNWFYGANPYDEAVHLLNGVLAGAVFGALLLVDRAPRGRWRMAMLGLGFGLALGVAWESFEWATQLIGDWTDTWTDVLLTALGAMLGTMFTPMPGWRPR